MNLLGQTVNHKTFGNGMIMEFSENRLTVCFAESQKVFLFPDAFLRHLTLKNRSIQKKVEQLNEERLQKIDAKKQKLERESAYRRRIQTMKIPTKSQVVYDISEEKVGNLESVDAGCILSGDRKGKPRVPSNIQPNSAILLTDCKNGEEEERSIIGVAMADEHFWGKDCRDGEIRLHRKYQLLLSDENRMLFWSYFTPEALPVQWGKVPFRYFQNQTMQRMLADICSRAAGTEQEAEAMELYRYFCFVNRLSES